MRWLAILLLIPGLSAQDHAHADPHRQRSAQEWIASLENPERDAWQQPDQVMEALALAPGERVADIGAGSGYFSIRFAQQVGQTGKVYAADINEGLIDHLAQQAKQRAFSQMSAVLAAPTDPHLEANSVDTIFICDVIHHIDNRSAYYPKLVRALRPGGRLVVIDFYKRELPVGPALAWKISKPEMLREITQAGFRLETEHTFLPYQYFLEFRLPQ